MTRRRASRAVVQAFLIAAAARAFCAAATLQTEAATPAAAPAVAAVTPGVRLGLVQLIEALPADPVSLPAAIENLAKSRYELADPDRKAAAALLLRHMTSGLPAETLRELPADVDHAALRVRNAAIHDAELARTLREAAATLSMPESAPPKPGASAGPASLSAPGLSTLAGADGAGAALAFDQARPAAGVVEAAEPGRWSNALAAARRAVAKQWVRLGGRVSDERGAAYLAEALAAGDWSDPVFGHPRVLYFAKASREKGLITEGQYVTLFLRWEAVEQNGWWVGKPEFKSTLPLLDAQGRLTAHARSLLLRAMVPRLDGRSELPTELEERFADALGRLPLSERQAWVLSDGRGREIVPSFGTLQAALEATHGKNAVRLIARDRAVTSDEIVDMVEAGGRVFGYSTPWGERQTTFDGENAGMHAFSLHDFLHAMIGSSRPLEDNRLSARLVKLLDQYTGERPLVVDGYVVQPMDRSRVRGMKNTVADLSFFGLAPGSAGYDLLNRWGADAALLVVQDMARHPEAWKSVDVDAQLRYMDANPHLDLTSGFRGGYRRAYERFKAEAGATRLAQALRAGDWSDPIMDHPRVLEFARDAFERGLISLGQHTTMFLRWEAFAEAPGGIPAKLPEPHPALDAEGKLTPFARAIADSYFYKSMEREYPRMFDSIEAALERLEALIAKLPASERSVWDLPAHLSAGSQLSIFAKDMGLVPSFGIMQAVIDAVFEAEAVQLIPMVRDLARAEVLATLGGGGRVLGHSASWGPTLTEADGSRQGLLGFSLHDFFHAFFGSMIQRRYRILFPRLAAIISANNVENGEGILNRMADLEFGREQRFNDWEKASLGDWLAQQAPWVNGASFLGPIVIDMARHPEAWKPFDVEREVNILGPKYVRLYEEARREAASNKP